MNIEAEIKRLKKRAAKLDRENEKLGQLPGIRTSSLGDPKISKVQGGIHMRFIK